MTQSLGELIERLTARGERVIIVGKGEPMVLLPLDEYEKLTAGQAKLFNGSGAVSSENTRLEPVDLPSGLGPDDDQYFPEPL